MRNPARKSSKAGKPARRDVGAEIIAGLKEAIAFERGDDRRATFKAAPINAREASVTPAPEFSAAEIVSIRKTLGLSQALFAQALNISAETEKAWEQGKAPPSGASKRLLQIAQTHPHVIIGQVVYRGDEPARPSRANDHRVANRRSGGAPRASASRPDR